MRIARISVLCALTLASQSAWAIQGNLQSSSGFVASTVGGATVAQFTNEFDAAIDNPALMERTKTTPGTHRFSLGLEYASYPNSFSFGAPGTAYSKGKVDNALIPFAGYFYNINEHWKFGTGFFGIGGTGYDYSNSAYKAKGSYAAISIPLAVSYKINDRFALGASLNLVLTSLTSNNAGNKDTKANALSITPSVGATLNATDSLVIGLDFGAGTTSEYKDFYCDSATTCHSLKIGTPAQASIGIGHNTNTCSIGFKFRNVYWKDTESYKQLGWKNQQTYSLGGQAKLGENFVGRAGLYYVTSVYDEKENVNGDETVTFGGQPLPKFQRDFSNAMMYGIPQWQYAIGGGFKLSKVSVLDVGIIYEPEASIKFTGTSVVTLGNYEIRKKNSNLQIFFTYTHEV